jgi:PAS domain S-box-containing protein
MHMTDPSEHDDTVPPAELATGTLVADPFQGRVLDAIRDYAVFTLDDAGCVTSWNTGARIITGYAPDEVLGKSYTLFGAQGSAADLARILQSCRQEGSLTQERWLRQRDGGLVWVDELISPFDEHGFVVIVRDLTERIETEERLLAGRAREQAGIAREEAGRAREYTLRSELQAAERRAAFLAEASSILVATSLDFDSTLRALVRLTVSRLADWCTIHSLDQDGNLVRAAIAHRDPRLEPALEQAADNAFSESWEQTVRSVVDTGQSQILDESVAARWFESDGSGTHELVRRIGHGTSMVTPLMGRGSVLGALTLVKTVPGHEYDEEDLSLAEELGRRAAIALDNARLYRDAQEANRAKADFLAVMSHELRTPLNAIMGYSDLLDAEIAGQLSARQRRQIDRIRASARHLLQLIEEILSFARIEAGGEELHLELADAGELAADAAAIIEPMAESKGLEFNVVIDDADVTLETDSGKVRQILVNLLSNAVKFTERGSVTLRFRRDGERAIYEVEDTGLGIPKEQVARIFDPFWQAEHPNTRRVGGTGLGLSVSRRYSRLLRGDLAVHSEPGRGTRFRIMLPLRITGSPGQRVGADAAKQRPPARARTD